ncbi:MAG: hypothetical protein AAF840_03805 [Bacteroidota bacterium]
MSEFISTHFSLIAKIVGGLFVLLVARKPALQLIRNKVELMNSKSQVSNYQIIRQEIYAMHDIVIMERKENRMLLEENEKLKIEIQQLRNLIENGKN